MSLLRAFPLIVLWASVAEAQQSRPSSGPPIVPPLEYKVQTLKNGLRIYSMRDTTTPSVAVSAWYDVGSKHDPEGLAGFAHLFEHLLSRKTENMPYNMINRLVEEAGGTRNAGTIYDYTNYYEIVPAQYLETMLWTHAERLGRAVLDTQVLNSERAAIDQEIRERILTNPYGSPGRLTGYVIPFHSLDVAPHRRAGVGDSEQLATATLDDVIAFRDAYYGPETVALIVAGNFDEAALAAWADKHLSTIPRRANPLPLRMDIAEPPRTSERRVQAFAPNVPFPAVVSSWKIPAYSHPDLPALTVLNAILTRGDNSRLRRSLVDERRLATQVGVDLRDYEDVGYYALWAIVAAGQKPADADSALLAEVARLFHEQVTTDELREAKNELLARALQQRETLWGRSNELGEGIVKASDPRAADKRLAAVRAVTAADVQRVARKYLMPNTRVAILYRNEDQRRSSNDSAGAEVPLPTFGKLPPARSRPLTVAAEGVRRQPPAPASIAAQPVRAMETKQLASGVVVVAAKTSDVPIATISLLIKGGAATDPVNKAGLTALVVDVARRGTKNRTAQQISTELEALGATLTTNVDYNLRDALGAASGMAAFADGVVLSVTAPVANLEPAARILADIAQNATLSAEELDRARDRALANFTVVSRIPVALASLVLNRAVFGSAPYGGGAGTAASLKSITLADVTESYRRWWQPRNAAVVVAGGVGSNEALSLAANLFGSWKAHAALPALPAVRAGRPSTGRTIVIDMPSAPQAAVLAAVPTVGRSHADFQNINVSNTILGIGSTSRLFDEVRTKRALSYGPGSWLAPRAEAGLIVATASTRNETAAEAAEVLLAQIDRLGTEPFAVEEVEKRKRFVLGIHNLLNETSVAYAGLLAGLLQQGVPIDEASLLPNRVAATDARSVSAASARLISGAAANLVIVGDASKLVEKLRQMRPNVEVIPVAEVDLDSPTLRKQ